MPLAKGLCCGLVSLKNALIFIALIDITIGAAAIAIGIIAFAKFKLSLSLAAYTIVSFFSLIFAIGAIIAIAKKRVKLMKIYFTWKCLEVLIIPLFELVILFVQYKADSS